MFKCELHFVVFIIDIENDSAISIGFDVEIELQTGNTGLMTNTQKTRAAVYDVLASMTKTDVPLRWQPGGPTARVAIMSEKGGVGKTALTTGLAAVATDAGLRVCVVDLDPRATATEELGIVAPEWSVNDVLYVDPTETEPVDITGAAAEALLPAGDGWPDTLRVLASERALGHREHDNAPGLELRLRMALAGVAEQFDLVLFDVPPRAAGKLASSAVFAASHAIFPATLTQDGLVGMQDALASVRKLRIYHPEGAQAIHIVGLVRNIVDRRVTSLASMYDGRFHEEHPDLLLNNVAIPAYTVRGESRSACLPITALTTPETTLLRRGYTSVLNSIREAM